MFTAFCSAFLHFVLHRYGIVALLLYGIFFHFSFSFQFSNATPGSACVSHWNRFPKCADNENWRMCHPHMHCRLFLLRKTSATSHSLVRMCAFNFSFFIIKFIHTDIFPPSDFFFPSLSTSIPFDVVRKHAFSQSEFMLFMRILSPVILYVEWKRNFALSLAEVNDLFELFWSIKSKNSFQTSNEPWFYFLSMHCKNVERKSEHLKRKLLCWPANSNRM